MIWAGVSEKWSVRQTNTYQDLFIFERWHVVGSKGLNGGLDTSVLLCSKLFCL